MLLGTSNSQAATGAPDPCPKARPRGILGAQASMPRVPGNG